MYSAIIDQLKSHLESSVNAAPIQVGYLGDFLEIDLRRSAVLLEPRKDNKAAKSTVWKDGSYQVRIWVMNEITRDFFTSMRDLEQLLETDEDGKLGVNAALNKLKTDPIFTDLSGTIGGKRWRINTARVIEVGDVDFGINQRASTRVNTAQINLTIFTEVER